MLIETFAIATLALVHLIQSSILTVEFFTTYKAVIDCTINLLGLMTLLAATGFTYFRFFKGRTFTKKLNIRINVKVFDAGHSRYLHVIDLRLDNQGSILLSNLRSHVQMRYLTGDGAHEDAGEEVWESFVEANGRWYRLVIEPRETLSHHIVRFVPKLVVAVTYAVIVEHPEGNRWTRMITVLNRAGHEHEDP